LDDNTVEIDASVKTNRSGRRLAKLDTALLGFIIVFVHHKNVVTLLVRQNRRAGNRRSYSIVP
jgi:hypothetical protein